MTTATHLTHHPALVAAARSAVVLLPDGEMLDIAATDLARALADWPPVLVIHAPAAWRRLGVAPLPCLDLLELFAFARPARACVPSAAGLADAADLPAPAPGPHAAVAVLPAAARALLVRLRAARALPSERHALHVARRMGAAGWPWAPFVTAALRPDVPRADAQNLAFGVWTHLPEWQFSARAADPSSLPVTEAEARARLGKMLRPGAEQRPAQADYAGAATAAFAPRETLGEPVVVMAEAGTGTGKTLGYLAPAVEWAERNGAPVWVSTYTKHLQRQVEAEFLDADRSSTARDRVVVRKGRENYLCLLKFEQAVTAPAHRSVVALGLLARWTEATADGDLSGGDLPGWFADLAPELLRTVADRRGECINGACPHWKKCFFEHGVRRASAATIVVANHALVMALAAWQSDGDRSAAPTRYVFDEGHHIFDAADGAFSAEFSGAEAADLRRWLLGDATGGARRPRGLAERLGDLCSTVPALEDALQAVLAASRVLPDPLGAGLLDTDATTRLLAAAQAQLLARNADPERASEADLLPASPVLLDAADALLPGLRRLRDALIKLADGLAARLDDEAADLDDVLVSRLEGAAHTVRRRGADRVSGWCALLSDLWREREPGARPEFVDLIAAERRARGPGTDTDVALRRHWLDPTIPFALALARPAHGMLITSATLRDETALDAEPERAWAAAEARVGASHLPGRATPVAVASPFDYGAQTRIFVVIDVGTDIARLAAAYRSLFLAAGGGGLGLFTAIARLRAVHGKIAGPLQDAGLTLLAQHVDAMDNATLVDIFRADENACLLGTDAMRDGVDVPGRALRLVVFERVPWPRPDILHRERRIHLSDGDPPGYDARIARMRLRQAFGRLIRRATDRGVFVLLDRGTPSRLLTAFPDGVPVIRAGLAETVLGVRAFLNGETRDVAEA